MHVPVAAPLKIGMATFDKVTLVQLCAPFRRGRLTVVLRYIASAELLHCQAKYCMTSRSETSSFFLCIANTADAAARDERSENFRLTGCLRFSRSTRTAPQQQDSEETYSRYLTFELTNSLMAPCQLNLVYSRARNISRAHSFGLG